MCKKNESDTIKALRGMVFFVNLGDNSNNKGGTVIKKFRPCVILSDNNYNSLNPQRYTVAPVVSREDEVLFAKTDVLFSYLNGFKSVLCDSVTSVSTHDIGNYVYSVSPALLTRIDNAIKVHFGYEPESILGIKDEDIVDYIKYREEKEGKVSDDDEVETEETATEIDTKALQSKMMGNSLSKPVSIPITEEAQAPTTTSAADVKDNSFKYEDLLALSKIHYTNWSVEQRIAFLKCFDNFSHMQVVNIFNTTGAHISTIKYQTKKRLIAEGINLDVLQEA